MLSIYEYQNRQGIYGYSRPRKLIISYNQSNLELVTELPMSGYIIPLYLSGDGKIVLQLGISPYQLSRIAQYWATGRWKGGILVPQFSLPRCFVFILSDLPKPDSDPRLNLKYGKAGLGFELDDSDIIVEWEDEDPKDMSETLSTLVRESYGLRNGQPPEKEPQVDLEEWKRHLFELPRGDLSV